MTDTEMSLDEAREELRRELPDAYDDGTGEPVIVLSARAGRILLDETYKCPACGQNCLGFDPSAVDGHDELCAESHKQSRSK